MDEDRHAPLGCKLEYRAQAVVARVELLGPGMELDPARAEVEAAGRLLDRLLVQIEPDEGNDAALRAGRKCQRAVVCRTERRVPVGLVEAEHEAARHPIPVHQVDQVVVAPDHAVDVLAEMHVGIEHLRPSGSSRCSSSQRASTFRARSSASTLGV